MAEEDLQSPPPEGQTLTGEAGQFNVLLLVRRKQLGQITITNAYLIQTL